MTGLTERFALGRRCGSGKRAGHPEPVRRLAGLTSWKCQASGTVEDFEPGVYGQTSRNVRISHYAQWIDQVIASAQVDGSGAPGAGGTRVRSTAGS